MKYIFTCQLLKVGTGPIQKTIHMLKFVAFFLWLGMMGTYANTYSQNISVDIKNGKLTDLFEAIQKQTDYSIIYKDNLIDNRTLTLSADNKNVEDILKEAFEKTGLNYQIYEKQITVLSANNTNLSNQFVQDLYTIQGRVFDSNAPQNPLVGVSINIKGTNKGTSTDSQGNFSISAYKGQTLVFSMLSFTNYEHVVNNDESNLKVSLQVDISSLEEVVVVGYGTTTRADLTGSVSTINGKSLENIPVQRVDQMLQGRAAGVEVKSVNGAPGTGTTIRIRGSRSINAGNEPLYVIDGIVDAGDLNTINPADIASIDILKDASAAAIYGSRASNGVIIITTKQGKPGRDIVTASASHGISYVPKHPEMMNAKEFIPFINEAYVEMGQPPLYPDPEEILKIVGDQGTPWIESIFQTGGYSNFDLALSGGNESFTYRLSGNVVDQKGTVIRSSYKRYQSRLNLKKEVNASLRFGLNINVSQYVREPGSNVNFGSNAGWTVSHMFLPPTMPMYKSDGTFESYNPIRYVGGGHGNTSVAEAVLSDATTRYNDLLSNIYGEYDIIDGLIFRTSFGTTLTNSRYNFYRPSYAPSNIANGQEYGDALSDIYLRQYLLNENTLSYTQNIGDHNFNILGGFTYQRRNNERMYIRGKGLTNDIVKWNDFASVPQDQRNTISNYNDNIQSSLVGRIAYDYSKKYYFTFTSRYDGASNFAKQHKWALFPSAALKWRISEEPFFKEWQNDIVNDLAFRVSYGLSGNQGISDYQSLATLSSNSSGYIFGGVPTLSYTQGRLENKDLKWEKSSQLNVGLDFQFLEGRLNFTTNYYDTKTKDLLLTVQIPRQTGYGSRLINLGKTRSSGFELEFSGDIVRNTNFKWNSVINLSSNKQRVIDIGPLVKVPLDDNGYGAQTNFLEIGVPIGAAYGVKYRGTWKNQSEIDEELSKGAGERTLVSSSNFYKPGKPRYEDHNGDGVLNLDDYHYLGTPHPKIFGGFGNSFQYKNLTLNTFLNFSWGNKMFNNMEFFAGTGTYMTNQMSYMVDRWTPSNPVSDIPGVNSRDNVPSTRFLHDASFIRLSSLDLSYDLTPLVFNQSGRRLSVYIAGRNLFLLTKYNGYDPEVNSGSTSSTIRAKDDGAYPNGRSYTIGFNLVL
ncbi:TonB-dependent receptor [Sphingobacterium sp. JB170]|uniref:TonB-dependent receptor n=1 Tax=Sphingobacterium sp. JB170 TaxID=1434842 RepID=UPI00097F3BD7|nr:TonB-dependent receptor [Sphingobacterium sp. JB170]SJN18396.1 TonB family protein / TonB-dependent receptor [Sphingobacterium sp. JB170]